LAGARKDVEKLPEIPQYDIQLEVDFENAAFTGTAQIDYTNLEEVDLDSLYFRLFPNSGKSYGSGSLESIPWK